MIKSAIPVLSVTDSRRSEDYYCRGLGFTKLFAYRPDPNRTDPCYLGVSSDGVTLHLHSFVSERGAICHMPPTDQTWRNRETGIRDPEGNVLVFATPLEDR